MVEPLAAALRAEPHEGGAVRRYWPRPMTLLNVLDEAVRDHGEVVSLATAEGSLTNRQFAELVQGAAWALAAAGIGPGDRVATCLRNSLESAVAFFACARLGAVLVALNTRLKPSQWAHQLGHSQPALVLSHPEWAGGVKQAAVEAGLPGDVLDPEPVLLPPGRPWALGDPPDQVSTYAILYTSGTTGRPKGVELTHEATIHAAFTYVRAFALGAGDRSLVVLPMFYISGIVDHIIPHCLTGGTSVMVDGFHAGRVVRRLAKEEATYFMGVPAMFGMMLREDGFHGNRLPRLRVAAYGGAPFPEAWVGQLRERFPRLALCEIYGLTETHSPATLLRDREFATKGRTVGRAIPGMDLRIVDERGADVPPGEAGELLLRGANVTPGYFRDPDATRAAFAPGGWFRTGDVARVDGNGYVTLLDRKKDMIERGAFKVYSVELEALLCRHPAVVEAAVVGAPAAIAGEEVAAFVVLDPGGTVTSSELRHWVAARVADYQVPRHVSVVDALPRNPTGKVDKPALRSRFTAT